MTSQTSPVALTDSEVEVLNKQLSRMRHDINNHLSLMMAAIELIRRKPEAVERLSATLGEEPAKISEAMKQFSAQFERTLGVKRD